MFSQLLLNQVISGMDLVPPNNDQVYIDLTGESSDDEPPLDAGATAEYIADDRSEITSDDSEEEPPAAAADEEEEETLAQRVKRRGNRRQRSHGSGSYQDLGTQQALAHEEAARLCIAAAFLPSELEPIGLGLNLWAAADDFKGESDAETVQGQQNDATHNKLNTDPAPVHSWSQMGLVASVAPDAVHQNVGNVHF
eukprot:COSAG02_NODE_4418_length_5382_cov_23.288283_6_plen_196_part_00